MEGGREGGGVMEGGREGGGGRKREDRGEIEGEERTVLIKHKLISS